jgi:hypothetical protein
MSSRAMVVLPALLKPARKITEGFALNPVSFAHISTKSFFLSVK